MLFLALHESDQWQELYAIPQRFFYIVVGIIADSAVYNTSL
jgi:hypothetical protein